MTDPTSPRPGSGAQRRITGWKRPTDSPWQVPGDSHAEKVIAFIEKHVYLPTGRGSGKLVKLRPWQKTLIRRCYGPDSRPNRAAMVSVSRGNGKSGLAAMLAVAELFLVENAEVLCLATSERQARIVYNRAARSIETSPTLAPHALVYSNKSDPWTNLPGRNSTMFPLPADERSLQGFAPTFAVVDETGFVEPGTWTAMTTAGGKHERSLVLGIGTPGYDRHGLMASMRELAIGKEPPPSFSYIEYAADPSAGVHDRRQWKKANPALGDFLSADALAFDVATLPPNTFRTFRLGQWVDRAEQWIGSDVWDSLPVVRGDIAPGSPITLGFDGSVAIDSTGLVAFDVALQRLVVLALWERPSGNRRWKVPRGEVQAAIDHAFQTWNVMSMFADPYYFRDMLEQLAEQYGMDRVISFPTNVRTRMAVATDRFATAVYAGALSWDGTDALRRHVLAATAEVTTAGDVIRKRADKPAPIDLAVCSVLAVEAAASAPPRPQAVIW